MNAVDVLARAFRLGIVLEPSGENLRWRAPQGTLTSDLREAMAEHKREILILLHSIDPPILDFGEALEQARLLRRSYFNACLELAEMVGYPKLRISKPSTICGGEAGWRVYLMRANVETLRDTVVPLLKQRIDAIGSPAKNPFKNE